ncbi:MAG TPA: tetratricopeptide repeat protein [Roseiflexaceae bacterium]|nr:tetratricopeptide repeat protein [Roseiflexaceae bacterium]
MANPSPPSQESWRGTAPLRRLSIAEVLDSAWQLYRANFRTFVSAVASVLVTMSILRALYGRDAVGGVDWLQLSPLRSEALLSAIGLLRTSIDPLDLIALFADNVLLYFVARVLLTGILVNTAARSYLGPFGASLPGRTRGLGREIALIPAVLLILPLDLQSAMVARGMRIAAPLVAALLQGTPPPLATTLDILELLGRSLLIDLLAVLLSARFLLAPQAVMLERRSSFASLGRSWNLTSGWFWRVVVVALASSALIGLLIGLPSALVRLILALSGWDWIAGILTNVTSMTSQVLEALALPFQVAVFTALFYDIRIRKEGFDLEVLTQQATEAEVQPLIDSGRQKQQQHDPRGALADFEQALRLKPNDAGIVGLCAYAYVALPDLRAALASSEQAVALDPHNPFTLNCRGYVKQASGDMLGALADYRGAVAIQPDYPIALAHFADAKLQAGDLAGALADLEQLLQLTPNDSRSIYNAASIYARQGQLDSALQRLRRAIDLKPTWREAASSDPDFDALRADPTFIALVG